MNQLEGTNFSFLFFNCDFLSFSGKYERLPYGTLQSHTQVAYCQEIYEQFDEQIVWPHGLVHTYFGWPTSTMSDFMVASYDPVFWLHHANVDRQYAFWQELQILRGKSQEAKPETKIFKMPPFTLQQVNPFQETRVNPTQLYGLDYQKNFGYKYDSLTFGKKPDGSRWTPLEFHNNYNSLCRQRTLAAIVVKNGTLKTRNSLQIVNLTNGSISANVSNVFVTIGLKMGISKRIFDFDLNQALTNSSHDLQTSQAHLRVVSSDQDGSPIPANAFKPTLDYIDLDGRRTIKIHVDYFEEYSPEVNFCYLDSAVEFLKSDGTYSDQVKRKVNTTGKTTNVTSPFRITTTKNEFIFKNHSISVDYDPSCHITVRMHLCL